MRLALNTPIVTATPGGHHPWEVDAGPDELAAVAMAADELGYDHMGCSEHVMVPAGDVHARGGSYWDPLSTLSWVAAHTKRIRLATEVLVLGYHHPLAIAKRYGTLDKLSGGRLVLGLGVGSLEQEFDLLGQPFNGRGEIADDALRALRASLGVVEPVYDGPHFSFRDVHVQPCAVQERVPLWIGGRTRRSLRRAVELGDGWMPFGLSPQQVGELLGAAAPPPDFEVVLTVAHPLDPIDDEAGARAAVSELADAGATMVSVKLAATSLAHYQEQMAAMIALGE